MEKSKNSLDCLFKPASIAVVGASNKTDSVGWAVFHNLKTDYPGKLFAVNPYRRRVQGTKCFKSVSAIGKPVELVIVATPVATVEAIIRDSAAAGARAAVIMSTGFRESGKTGAKIMEEIMKTAGKKQMRILGPNCLGFINSDGRINATFAKATARPGSIVFISQSGALGSTFLDWAQTRKIGFRYFVSVGDMADVGFAEVIDYIAEDPEVSSLVLYMESLTRARIFMSSVRAFARQKPVVVLKSGVSREGAGAALSHTGNLSGNDTAFEAAFRRAGVLRVGTIEEMFNMAQTLTMRPKISNNRLAVVTNAGGPGVVATDAIIRTGGVLAEFTPRTQQVLKDSLPGNTSVKNPVDILGDADCERFRTGLEAVLDDENTDGVIVIVSPQMMTDSPAIAKMLTAIPNSENKPILACLMGGVSVQRAISILENAGMRNYQNPEDAAVSFMHLYNYSRNIEMLYEAPPAIPAKFAPDRETAGLIIEKAYRAKRTSLTEVESKKLLAGYGLPVPESRLAGTAAAAVRAAERCGFPVMMKIVSPDIFHKSEVGGYQKDIGSKKEAEKAYRQIKASVAKKAPKARIDGVIVEKMYHKRYELFMGSKKDPVFGPVIVFGMGGVAVEVFKDTAAGLPPLNTVLARELINRTKISSLLAGYRNLPGIDMADLYYILYKFAYLVADFPQIAEIDINPLAVDEKSGVILDAKVILDPNAYGKRPMTYDHLAIAPYPERHTKTIKAKNGREINFRPIRPEDEPLEEAMFKTFSEESQRFRFFGLKKKVTHQILARYTNIDYDREIAIAAETEEKGDKKMIGVVRIITEPNGGSAELAIIVGDPWQRLGVGSKLLDYGLAVAKEEGIRAVHAFCLEDNEIIHKMFKKRGFKMTKEADYFRAERKL